MQIALTPRWVLATLLGLAAPWVASGAEPIDTSAHRVGFTRVNGIRLQFLDWGGSGPALIFIHGAGDNPHVFDDLAPAFTDRFRVIAYARRGSGESEARGPYDNATLTADLLGLMNSLHVSRADLVGWSQGGNEITELAGKYPARVRHIVYLDGGYDWGDPEFVAAFRAMPPGLRDPPASAMKSWDAYVSYEKNTEYSGLDDMGRISAYLRGTVVMDRDGSLQPRIPQAVSEASLSAMLTDRRDYLDVRAPVLAIYAQSMFDLATTDVRRREIARAWDEKYMTPFRTKSVDRVRHELQSIEVVFVPGTHDSFFLTSRQDVVTLIRRFLSTKSIEVPDGGTSR